MTLDFAATLNIKIKSTRPFSKKKTSYSHFISKELPSHQVYKNIRKFIDYIDNRFDFKKAEYPFNIIYLWLEQNVCEE